MNKKLYTFKKSCKVIGRCTVAAFLFFSSLPALSAVPYRNSFEEYDLIHRQTKELNLPLFARIQIVVDQNQFNLAHYVPFNNLPQHADGELIARRIVQHTLKTVLNELDLLEESSVVRSIDAVNSALSTSVDRKGHSFKFRFKALETSAEFVYKGVVDAALSYDMQAGTTELQVSRNIASKTYAYTHTNANNESRDVIGVRWSF